MSRDSKPDARPASSPSPPTVEVGQTVQFFSGDRSLQTRGFGAGPYAAIAMRVDGASLDLTIFAVNRPPFPVYAVPHGGEDGFARSARDPSFSKWWRPIPQKGR